MNKTIFFLVFLMSVACTSEKNIKTPKKEEKTQPNILWIVIEDSSPTFSFYGDKTAKTPNLNTLAKESVIYDNAFAPVGVCGPSRSSIITGMYPTSIGTMHMRTGKDIFSWGSRSYKKETQIKDLENENVIQYAAVIPENVKCYTEYLRIAGYYTTNNYKTDYQFAAPVTAWDENNQKAHWKNTPEGKAFFSVFNIGTTHESRLWKNENLPLTVNPKGVKVPPYLPDNEATRRTIARYYSNVELMDAEVGEIINQLKKDGLYDNTIIFFYSDHGGPLPRQKREIYDSGLKVPFMIKGINGEIGRTDRMISFVDLAPTMLSLAGVKAPDYMEGKAFLGSFIGDENEYVFGSSDRFDEFTDRIRAVRNKQFLYLKNEYPELTKYKDVGYRKNIAMMPVFLDMKESNQLDDIEKKWFQTKTEEELYDCIKDPHIINNLAEKMEYQTVLAEMRTTLETHLKGRKDYGLIPESKMIQEMWPNYEQPTTTSAIINIDNKKVTLLPATKGASIAYIISDNVNEKLDFNSKWQLYHQPITVEKGKTIYIISQRIGFKESEIIKHNF
jgi:N-sulfoglucosamine sulfohydrolase